MERFYWWNWVHSFLVLHLMVLKPSQRYLMHPNLTFALKPVHHLYTNLRSAWMGDDGDLEVPDDDPRSGPNLSLRAVSFVMFIWEYGQPNALMQEWQKECKKDEDGGNIARIPNLDSDRFHKNSHLTPKIEVYISIQHVFPLPHQLTSRSTLIWMYWFSYRI